MTETLSVTGPEEQIETYRDEADEMNCSYAEYGRMMINAGRRELGYVSPEDTPSEELNDVLQVRIAELLATHGALTDEEVVNKLMDELRGEIRAALSELQDQEKIEYDYLEEGITYVG